MTCNRKPDIQELELGGMRSEASISMPPQWGRASKLLKIASLKAVGLAVIEMERHRRRTQPCPRAPLPEVEYSNLHFSALLLRQMSALRHGATMSREGRPFLGQSCRPGWRATPPEDLWSLHKGNGGSIRDHQHP